MIKLINNQSVTAELPEPSSIQKEQSDALIKTILANIKANNNWLNFKDYMNLALYHPNYGYYTAGSHKIGKSGDFITAPELGPAFSYAISNNLCPILKQHPFFNILEFGAGTGKLAFDLLTHLSKKQVLPPKYFILEVSAELKHRQQQLLANLPTDLYNRIEWLTTLPDDNSFEGVVLANEVVDAMPVHLFEYDNNQLFELGLTSKDNNIFWQNKPAEIQLQNYIEENILPLDNSYTSEVNLIARDWLASLSMCLAKGAIYLIDYGFNRDNYYHPDRNSGTLNCHYRHHSHHDPLLFPGLQDITAHVDFTSLAEIAVANDLTVELFCNQASFLLASNITDIITNNKVDSNTFKLKHNIKVLTHPSEMGELFKILILNKDINPKYFNHLQVFDKRGLL